MRRATAEISWHGAGGASLLLLRGLALGPVCLVPLALGVAAMLAARALRESEWLLFVLAVPIGLVAWLLVRRAYRGWRRPSATSVREGCGWIAFMGLCLASWAVERLGASGRDILAWIVAATSIPLVVAVYLASFRFVLRGVRALDGRLRKN